MTQGMQFRRHMLGLKILKAYTVRATPVHPIIGVIEFDANVAHQPAPRHVFAGMAGKAGLGEVLCHIQRELLDNWLFGRQAVHTKVFTVVDDVAGGPLDALGTTTGTWLDDPFGLEA